MPPFRHWRGQVHLHTFDISKLADRGRYIFATAALFSDRVALGSALQPLPRMPRMQQHYGGSFRTGAPSASVGRIQARRRCYSGLSSNGRKKNLTARLRSVWHTIRNVGPVRTVGTDHSQKHRSILRVIRQ